MGEVGDVYGVGDGVVEGLEFWYVKCGVGVLD